MKNIFLTILTILLLTSCATIFGGARYNAKIVVRNSNNTQIMYQGRKIGQTSAFLKFRRKNADHITFEVKKEGFKTENFSFHKKEIRATALLLSILSGIGVQQQYPGRTTFTFVPWFLIDIINYSSLWKPSTKEIGVVKENYNNYRYELNFKGVPINPPKKKIVVEEMKKVSSEKDDYHSTAEKLRDLKKLLDEEVIDESEYKLMKNRIIGIEENIPKEKIENNPKEDVEVEKEVKIEGKETLTTKTVEDPNNQSGNEKLKDLNKMLEFGIISQDEYDKMKEKLIND